ncbi:MAG: glutathione S-transferase family protein [Alphaproteobacteria bacterium]|nr:glutathione S-transferase family protein [Alphaproteobacteria bacterium]
MLTVWGRKTSSNVQALMWCIAELGLAYERHDVGHNFGGTDTDEFFALNPNRSIPVLQDGTNPPLWETGCILRYLANQYRDEAFWPTELLARTEVDRWAEWSKINVAMGFTVPIFWRLIRAPKDQVDHGAIRVAVTALEERLAIADSRLFVQSFLVGEALTLADIQFGHVLYRYYDIDITRANLPNLARYYTRLTKRPAFQEHVMVSYDVFLTP